MTSVPQASPANKHQNNLEPPGQREFLITSLRAASARARLLTNTFDTIGTSLRHRMISCDEAVAWLNEEGLLAEIEYRPGMSAAGGTK
jgi:hypothetical protein